MSILYLETSDCSLYNDIDQTAGHNDNLSNLFIANMILNPLVSLGYGLYLLPASVYANLNFTSQLTVHLDRQFHGVANQRFSVNCRPRSVDNFTVLAKVLP